MNNDDCNLKSVFSYFDIEFSWDDFEERIKNVRNSRKPDREIVKREGIFYDHLSDGIPDGRFFSEIGSAHLECFFHKGTEKGLIVFLTTARTGNNGTTLLDLPFFTRWSFHRYTDYSCLCITDPTYYAFSKCKVGWYFGTEKQNYRKTTAELISHIAQELDIPAEKIILYGSSAGGTGAIEISRFIDGCSVISINPQLNLSETSYFEYFARDTGISIPDYDKYDNNYDPVKTIKASSNNILLIENIRSKRDFGIHLRYLCEQLKITPKYGISKFGNLHIWLYDAVGAPKTHSSQENNILFRGILSILKAIQNQKDIDSLCGIARLINEVWVERWDLIKGNKDLNQRVLEKESTNEYTKNIIKESKVYSFSLKKRSEQPHSINITFDGESCIIHATRFFSDNANNVNSVFSFDFWNENAVEKRGDGCDGLVFIKARKSRSITIVNNNPFTVAFVVLG